MMIFMDLFKWGEGGYIESSSFEFLIIGFIISTYFLICGLKGRMISIKLFNRFERRIRINFFFYFSLYIITFKYFKTIIYVLVLRIISNASSIF